MYRSDPRYWCYILARDFEVVWDKLIHLQVWFEDTNMVHPQRVIHHFKRVVIILKPMQAEVAPPLFSHCASYPFALALLGWEWRWGADFQLCCSSILVRGQATASPSCSYMQWFNWNYWPVVSNLRGQSASDWHITPVVFRDPPCSFSLGELLYVLLLAFIIACPTFTDRLSWKQTCFLHSALL